MNYALDELDRVIAEPNENTRQLLYRRWKRTAVAVAQDQAVVTMYDAEKIGMQTLIDRCVDKAALNIAKLILENSAMSFMQLPETHMDATRMAFRCAVLRDRP